MGDKGWGMQDSMYTSKAAWIHNLIGSYCQLLMDLCNLIGNKYFWYSISFQLHTP